jgi:hypothetical protein
MKQADFMPVGIIAAQYNKKGKSKIDDNGGESKEEVQSCITQLIVTEPEQWNESFNNPEEQDTAYHGSRTLPGFNMLKKIDDFFHGKLIIIPDLMILNTVNLKIRN